MISSSLKSRIFLKISKKFQLKCYSTSLKLFQQQEQSNSSSLQNKNYRFTYNNANGKLSEEQRDFYEKNGYIIIKKLLPDNDIDRYWQRFLDIAHGKIEISPLMILQKDLNQTKEQIKENTLYKIQELYTDDILFEYCCHPNILDLVEAFVGSENILAIHSMLINKPPDTGSKSTRHPLHQDFHAFPLRPANRIVASWTAMEKISKENGCLSAIPGSHLGEYYPHDYPQWEGGVNKIYYGIQNLSKELLSKRKHLEMERGDCIFFHPLLIHGSGMNRTNGYRKAISCHYASATDCYYVDVMGTTQEKLAKEILEIYFQKIKKMGATPDYQITYADLWKYRSRLVRGKNKNGTE